MGGRVHAQRRVHQGVRLRRQSALHAGHGARCDGKEPAQTARAAAPGPDTISRSQPRCDHTVALATRRRGAGAARPENGVSRNPRRGTGFRVLYRLQCAQDAAYRAAGARYHGCARRHLSGNGWADPLLRHPSVKYRRRRNVRPYGLELDRKDVALEVRPGDLVVPELLRPVHGSHDFQPSNGNADRGHSR